MAQIEAIVEPDSVTDDIWPRIPRGFLIGPLLLFGLRYQSAIWFIANIDAAISGPLYESTKMCGVKNPKFRRLLYRLLIFFVIGIHSRSTGATSPTSMAPAS